MNKSKAKQEVTLVIETYQDPRWKLGEWAHDDSPSCVNRVSYRKHRVTCELIDEPVEVLGARLQKLWEESDNFHHWPMLEKEAKAIGYELKGQFGIKGMKRR